MEQSPRVEHVINSEVLASMRKAWHSGANAMEVARNILGTECNATSATEISYDLQAGTYRDAAIQDPEFQRAWGRQAASLVAPYLQPGGRLLEVGAGDGTTLAATLPFLEHSQSTIGATDLSWSRCRVAREVLGVGPRIWASDMFHLPLASASVDVILTAHALEPNGGRELDALTELVRVARTALVLIEPIYELASSAAQSRMRHHAYVKGLAENLADLPVVIVEQRLLEVTANSLNPSGVIVALPTLSESLPAGLPTNDWEWSCPVSGTPLVDYGDCFFSPSAGLAYPTLRGIPVLRPNLAIVAGSMLSAIP